MVLHRNEPGMITDGPCSLLPKPPEVTIENLKSGFYRQKKAFLERWNFVSAWLLCPVRFLNFWADWAKVGQEPQKSNL